MKGSPALRLVVAAALAAFIAPPNASAQSTRAGVVTTLHGTATIARASTPEPAPLKFKDDVFLHDRIATGDDSVARILLGGKAIVTVRERSVLTITEAPGVSNVDVAIGKVAVAVAKERMKPGESVQIRTPNTIAGIRGTVVVAEVDQATRDGSAPGSAYTSRITVLRGLIDVTRLDASRQPVGGPVMLGAMQAITVTDGPLPAPQAISRETADGLSREFKIKVHQAPSSATATLTESQFQQAVSYAALTASALTTNGAASTAPAGDDLTSLLGGATAPVVGATTSLAGAAATSPVTGGSSGLGGTTMSLVGGVTAPLVGGTTSLVGGVTAPLVGGTTSLVNGVTAPLVGGTTSLVNGVTAPLVGGTNPPLGGLLKK